MGNCFRKSKAEIAPSDFLKSGNRTTVRLYGSAGDLLTAYIRFALLFKSVPLQLVPGADSPVLQVGSDTVSGSREEMLRYIDARFPHAPLLSTMRRVGLREGTPGIVMVTALQHRSVSWHLERLVKWAGDLAARGGRRAVDPAMGSPRMELKKFARSYSQLLEVMLEHAQMEERVIFPILQMADPGLCKAANEEHARDLPIMNGIKEDIKSIGVLDSGSPSYHEALSTLLTRLKSLQGHCKEHFKEEEREALPLLEAVELTKEQQERIMEECVEVMQGTHCHLLHFLIEGLRPREAMRYLDLFISCNNEELGASMLRTLVR